MKCLVLINGRSGHSAQVHIQQRDSVYIRLFSNKDGDNYLQHMHDNHTNDEIDIVITDEINGSFVVHRAKAVIIADNRDDNCNLISLDCECTPRYDRSGNIDGVNYSVEWMDKL